MKYCAFLPQNDVKMIKCMQMNNIIEGWQQISTLLVNPPPPHPLILHQISGLGYMYVWLFRMNSI